MRALAALSSLLLTALLLSGCAGDADPVAADAAEAPADGEAAAASPSAPDQVDDATVREEALEKSGQSPVGVCAGVSNVYGSCFNELGSNFEELPRDTLAVRGTLTWTATSPATETMGALLLVPCGDNCWTSTSETPFVYGTSPLTVDLDATGLDGEVALWISGYQGQGTPVGWAGAHLPQEFTFDGVVVRLA